MINLNLQKMHSLMGSVSLIPSSEKTGEVTLSLDSSSKRNLETILKSGTITAETQVLYVNELIVSQRDEALLIDGQSPFIQHGNVYSVSAQPRRIPHFKATFQTVAPLKSNGEILYAIEIKLQNFMFDFANARKEISGEEIIYENVQLTIFSGNHSIQVLED